MRARPGTSLLVIATLAILLFGCSQSRVDSDSLDLVPEEGKQTEESAAAVDGSLNTDISSDDKIDVSEVVATVDGLAITLQAFEAARVALYDEYEALYEEDSGASLADALQGATGYLLRIRLDSEVLEQLTYQLIIEQEIERQQIAVDEDAVSAHMESEIAALLEQQGVTETEFQEALEERGYPYVQFLADARESIRLQMEIQALKSVIASSVAPLSDDEVAQYYELHRTEYENDLMIRASHIQVDTEEEARTLLAQLREGKDFATLAETYSTCESASSGGDLGWFGEGIMVPEFEEAAFSLTVNEISDVIHTDYGYHIILVTDRIEEHRPEFEEIADQVRADAESETTDERFTTWYTGVRAETTVVVYDPEIYAVRQREEDLDLGIQAFENLLMDEETASPYVLYILGGLYEQKYEELLNEQASIVAGEESVPSEDPESLDSRIIYYGQKALNRLYRARDWLDSSGIIDDAIESRISALEAVVDYDPSGWSD